MENGSPPFINAWNVGWFYSRHTAPSMPKPNCHTLGTQLAMTVPPKRYPTKPAWRSSSWDGESKKQHFFMLQESPNRVSPKGWA